MTRILLIAHAPLASALCETAVHAFPDAAPALACYDVAPAVPVDVAEAEAARVLAAMGGGEVLVLTDVFGATPCNIARRLAEQAGVRVLAGVNVPMLWRALNYRQRALDEVVTLALAGAMQGVMPVNLSPPQNQVLKPASHDPQDSHHQQ